MNDRLFISPFGQHMQKGLALRKNGGEGEIFISRHKKYWLIAQISGRKVLAMRQGYST